MPRNYRLDPYGIIAAGDAMYGGSGYASPFSSVAPTFKGGMPGIKFRTAFADGGMVEGVDPQVMPEVMPQVMPAMTTQDLIALASSYGVEPMDNTRAYGMGGANPYTLDPVRPMGGVRPYGMGGANPYTLDPVRPMGGGPRPYGMGGPSPYTIGQPAMPMGGPVPRPAVMPQMQPQPMQAQQRDPRQPQMQPQMQGGQMMNRPFAVRGR